MKCPQLSKPEATTAMNQNSIGDRTEKKPLEKPGSVGGPVPLWPDEPVVYSNCSKVSVRAPLVPVVLSQCLSRWQSPHLSLVGCRVGWSSLLIRIKEHWYIIIFKAILGMLPSYLCCLIKQKTVEKYFLCSQNCYTLSVPFVQSELGKNAFMYAAPSDWNLLQSKLKLQN